jgi:hypothetical protein
MIYEEKVEEIIFSIIYLNYIEGKNLTNLG